MSIENKFYNMKNKIFQKQRWKCKNAALNVLPLWVSQNQSDYMQFTTQQINTLGTKWDGEVRSQMISSTVTDGLLFKLTALKDWGKD